MGRSRVLLGDDHGMFSEGLQRILEPQFDVVGMAENGRDLIDETRRLLPDVVVTDISMPLLNGIEAARRIKKRPRPPKIIFLTMHEDPTFVMAAFRAGASGYVLKRSPSTEIVMAIHEAVRGHSYLSPAIAGGVLDILIQKDTPAKKFEPKLTSRQREILQLFAEGKCAKEIAVLLNISTKTVEFHKYRIVEVTGARTIAELTRYAIAHGIAQPLL